MHSRSPVVALMYHIAQHGKREKKRIKYIFARDFPFTLPPSHIVCSYSQAISIHLEHIVNEQFRKQLCSFNNCNIIIERFASDNLNFQPVQLDGLTFKPILDLNIEDLGLNPKSMSAMLIPGIQNAENKLLLPYFTSFLNTLDKELDASLTLISWRDASLACNAENATLPNFNSKKEVQAFIGAILHRWHAAALRSTFKMPFTRCSLDIVPPMYQEIAVYIGLYDHAKVSII